jgi:hypothetical protein
MVFGGKSININNNNNNINIGKMVPQESLAGTIVFMFLTMFVVGLLITGVIYLIKIAQQCLEAKGFYEPFVSQSATDSYKKNLMERIQKIKQINAILDDSIDTFNDNVQDTCEVYAQVEEIYVGNNSSPASEDEYSLPNDELNRRMTRRKQSAKKRFQEARTMYGASINTPVYECFENPASESVADLEDELRSELEDLETKIQSVQKGTVGQKGDSLNALLKFNNKYIKKSLQEMGNEKSRLVEGFAGLLPPSENPPLRTSESVVSGAALLKRADIALIKANAIYGNITDQQSAVNKQQELVKEINKTTSRIESGNVTSSDLGRT